MNSAMILRSPMLAGGGPVHVVRLYEEEPFAHGGLARGGKPRGVTLHLSLPEVKRLTARWGAPRRNLKTRLDEYAFPRGSLKKFADGGGVGYSPPPQMSAPLTVQDESLRTRNAGPADYYTYGMGPEHQFYTPNPNAAAPAMVRLPTTPTGPATQSVPSGGGGSGLNLGQVGGALTTAAGLANLLGYNNAYTQGAATAGNLAGGNYMGALKSGAKLYGSLSAPSMADYASGAATSDALTKAGFTGTGGPPPIDATGNAAGKAATAAGPSALSRGISGAGGALNIYGGIKQGGVQGYGQAATGAAQLASAAGIGGSALSQAVPVLGAITGGAGTIKAIKAGDTKSAAMSGAATGASIGSIVPGVGTAIGAVIGGIVGAAGALIQGKDYKEEDIRDAYYSTLKKGMPVENSQQFIDPKMFYESVAGEFRGSRSKFPPRASGKYGQKDEDVFINDLKGKIDQAKASGLVGANDNAQAIMQKVVDPWFQKDFGGWQGDPRYPDLINNQKAMTTDLINRYISGSPVDWDVITKKGKAHGGLATLAEGGSRHVRGPGTGRSDSIPAQLSDGEYVLTAEDVSLLGDGSNEAGAKRLDQFREQLRKHKGGALARGKISPNAKAPMQYMRGMKT